MPKLKTASTRRAKRRDKLARWVITLGGIAVIASVIAILALIVGVTVPLFRTPQANTVCTCRLPESLPKERVLRLGIDMDMDGTNVTGFVWSENGAVAWLDLRTGELVGQERLLPPGGDAKGTLRRVEPLGAGKYSLSWSDGGASLVEVVAQRANQKDPHAARYAVRPLASVAATPSGKKPRPAVAPLTVTQGATAGRGFIRRSDAGAITRAECLPDGTIAILRQVATETPLGDEEVTAHQTVVREEDVIPHIRAMTMDHEGNALYAGTDDGHLVRWQLDEKGEVAQREAVLACADGRAVTALALVLGDVSLAVGDAKGGLTVWSPVNADGTRKLRPIHQLQPHQGPIREILPSGRNKSVLSLGADGVVIWTT